jgi:FkbM family methyltransferase
MGEPTPVPLPDGRVLHVYSDAETRDIYREVFVDREYLQHGIVIRPGDCVFDVGANIGLFSLFAHEQAPGVRLHAFEPAPPLFEVLQRNARSYFPDATLHACGIADTAGVTAFTFYRHNSQASTLRPFSIEQGADMLEEAAALQQLAVARETAMAHATRKMTDCEIYQADMRTLSDVFASERVDRLDLLKVDAEGSEWEVLKGIGDEHWARISQIVLEVHHRQTGRGDEIPRLLTSRGYDVRIEPKRHNPVVALLDIRMVYARRAREN